MTKIQYLRMAATALPLLPLAGYPGQTLAQSEREVREKRPNILWISTEDFSPHLGCYGDSLARTPHLDRLAEQGVLFTHAFTTAAISAPCRAGIITGMYQTSIGCMHMRTTSYRRGVENPLPFTAVPPHYVKAFTEYLRAAGYYCTNNAKTDYQFSVDPVPASIWDECGTHAHYRNRPDRNQPFFAVFNHLGTHESQNWEITRVTTDPASVKVPPYYPDTEIVRRNLARSYDNIARLDSVVGALLAELEAEGEAGNTLVFFWGDHGDGLPRAKRWLYDSGLHIPLIIRWPGRLTPGTKDDRLVSSIDFGPTLLAVAGLDLPVHLQGRPFLGDKQAEPRRYLFAARDRVDESYDMVRSVRSHDFLYIRNFYPQQPYDLWVPYLNRMPIMQEMHRLDAEGKLEPPQRKWMEGPRPAEELYDVHADPYQLHNLARNPAYGEVITEMRLVQEEWSRETRDMGHINELEMVEQMWPGGRQPVTDYPWFIVNAPEERALKNHNEGGTYSWPLTISLWCPTQGASVVYTTETGDHPHWHLYSQPLRPPKGTFTLRTKAVRYGYGESTETTGIFQIE